MNLYETLGVNKHASKNDIKKAFRSKARETHPDKEHGDKEKFQAVQSAYAVLKDDIKRDHYDKTGQVDQKKKPDFSPVEEAEHRLATLFEAIISENDFSGNIIERIKRQVSGIPLMVLKDRQKTEHRLRLLEKQVNRIIRKDGENSFSRIIETKIISLESHLNHLKKEAVIAEKLIHLVNEYEDLKPEDVNQRFEYGASGSLFTTNFFTKA